MTRRKRKAEAESKTQLDEYATFESALKNVLKVSHKEMQKRIKRNVSDRAATSKG